MVSRGQYVKLTLRERQHTEQSLIVRIGKFDAEVIIKKCARRIVAHC